MESKNLDIVLETPKSVTLADGTEVSLKPLPVMEALGYLELVKEFRVNLLNDLLQTKEKVFEAVDMLFKRSDYKSPDGKTWQEDERVTLQVLQDSIDVGLAINVPKSKAPATM